MLKSDTNISSGPLVSVVIVSHNSGEVLNACLQSLREQSLRPAKVVIVDSGSTSREYLTDCCPSPDWTVLLEENIGFSAANNRGLSLCPVDSDYVLFANPDTILPKNALEYLSAALAEATETAIMTGSLLGYDYRMNKPTGLYDSTGILRSWYGRWYDRSQGMSVDTVAPQKDFVPAICGAFMFCRMAALQPEMPELFDESFFMYKEDIELCLRLRNRGWKLVHDPGTQIFHGRGWARERKAISRQTRLMAARNEIRLYVKHPSPYITWAILKYGLVKLFNV